MASEQPNVDEHGNVVVTYRQALGKEKKKRDGDESDDDDGLLRGEVEDYQPLRPDRLRPFTREAIEAEKRERWVSREFPDEIRERTSMADLRVRSRRFMKVPSLDATRIMLWVVSFLISSDRDAPRRISRRSWTNGYVTLNGTCRTRKWPNNGCSCCSRMREMALLVI